MITKGSKQQENQELEFKLPFPDSTIRESEISNHDSESMSGSPLKQGKNSKDRTNQSWKRNDWNAYSKEKSSRDSPLGNRQRG